MVAGWSSDLETSEGDYKDEAGGDEFSGEFVRWTRSRGIYLTKTAGDDHVETVVQK